jgi:hypothetical protein
VNNKILIITSPDYFHGNMMKALLINPIADEKNLVQDWFKDNDIEMTLYVYNNDDDITWLLNIVSTSDSIYFNVDNTTDISYNYISYLISNPKVTYKSQNLDYSLINQNRTYDINEYIQRNWLG